MTQTHPDKRYRIFKSSAGSGKTFTLVRSYLGIVLRKPESYRSVLAITFTNKAMGEMKERIVKDVFEIASGKETPVLDKIMEDTGMSHAELKTNAATVLSSILHDYANFSVQTIDSFMYKLLRNFSRDLDLPSRFDVELDTAALLGRMMDQLMDSIGQDPYVTEILINFAEEKLRTESGWQIEGEVVKVAGEIFSENSKGPIDRLNQLSGEEMKGFITHIRDLKEAYPKEVLRRVRQITDMVRQAGVDPGSFFGGQHSLINALRKLNERSSHGDFKYYLEGGKMNAALMEDKWFTKSSADAKAIEGLLDRGLRTMVEDLRSYHDEAFPSFLTAHFAYANIHSLAVLRQIEILLESHKKQNSVLHISDFQRKVGDFIRNEAPDYIYWRMGEKYRHFLFDEFQDTSVMQWHNLSPLFDYVRTSDDKEGSLLLVGDAKQAIYRWRGGESDLIDLVVPAQFDIEPEVLGTNYRSLEYVVAFNNAFFETAMQVLEGNELVSRTFRDVTQAVKPGNEGAGLVQIHTFPKVKKKEEYVELALERCLNEIRRLLDTGYRMADIAILVRTSHEGSEVARHLDANGIRVISSDSLLLSKEPVINFILSLFRFLNDPLYGINRAEVLHYFFHYLHGDADLDVDRNDRIRELMSDPNPVRSLIEQMPEAFQKLRFKLDQLPLYELVEETIRIFDLKDKAPAYVQQFLDLVLEYAERKKPDLPGFLAWWDEKKDSFAISMPKGQDAVEIMTIHKSKGLQFPVVFIPFATWDMQPKRDGTFWAQAKDAFEGYPDTYLIAPSSSLEDTLFEEDYHDELKRSILDNLNLLYVAFTRPEERLYVFTSEDVPKTLPVSLKELNSVGKLIHLVREAAGFEAADGQTFETGMPTPPLPKKIPGKSHEMTNLISEPWRDRIRIERKVRRYWEGTTEPTDTTVPDGTVMKDVLGGIAHQAGLEEALEGKLEEGIITPEQRERILSHLTNLLAQAPFTEWYAEQGPAPLRLDIVSKKGILQAPDRVLRAGGKVTALYFADDARPAQFDRAKAAAYGAGLREMGINDAHMHLVWLPSGKLESL